MEIVHRDCIALHPGDRINLWNVFPDSPVKGMIGVQLYFAKVMGCLIVESRAPFDLSSFSSAIMDSSPHPNLYLKFGTMQDLPKQAGQSDLWARGSSACFIHTVGMLSVMVLHAPDGEALEGKKDAWHPRVLSDCIDIAQI